MIDNNFMILEWPEANKNAVNGSHEINLSNNIVLFDDPKIFDFDLYVGPECTVEYECFIDTKEAVERAKKLFSSSEKETSEDVFYGIKYNLKLDDYDLDYTTSTEDYFENGIQPGTIFVDNFRAKKMQVTNFKLYKYLALENIIVEAGEDEYAEHLGLNLPAFKNLLGKAEDVVEVRPEILDEVSQETELPDWLFETSDGWED